MHRAIDREKDCSVREKAGQKSEQDGAESGDQRVSSPCACVPCPSYGSAQCVCVVAAPREREREGERGNESNKTEGRMRGAVRNVLRTVTDKMAVCLVRW